LPLPELDALEDEVELVELEDDVELAAEDALDALLELGNGFAS
jgi:hypothetical protein